MDNTGRLVLVIGVLLGVPLLVILLVTGSDDGEVFRRDDRAEVAATPTRSPSPTPASTATPVAVEVDPTELPSLAGCEDEALVDEEARRAAFQDSLRAEREGGEVSDATAAWLDALDTDLSTCASSLDAGNSQLRSAMDSAVEAVAGYRDALAAPDDNSVSGAWSDLEDALDDVIDRWANPA